MCEKLINSEVMKQELRTLRATKGQHLDVLESILKADEGRIYNIDLLVFGVVQRSLNLIDGFALLVEAGNMVSAVPLLRLQLDTAMRLYACWLVPNRQDVLRCLLEDRPLCKLRSGNGQALTDAYLHAKLCEQYPWASDVYRKTCSFIHMSSPAVLAPVGGVSDTGRGIDVCIGNLPARQWQEADLIQAIAAFRASTAAVLDLCGLWLTEKSRQGRANA